MYKYLTYIKENEEQEILVFDPAMNITDKDLISIKVVVPPTSDRIGLKLGGRKYADVDDIHEAKEIITSIK